MTFLFSMKSAFLFAAEESMATRKLQYDLPKTFEQWLLLVVVGVALLSYIVWLYVKDTRSLHWFWRGWLMLLRVAVVAGLAVIFFNPHIRSQDTQYRPSKVAIVIDKSLSMRFAAEDLENGTPAGDQETRAEAAARLLGETELLDELQKTHQVKFYTFGSQLEDGPEDLESQSDPDYQKRIEEQRLAAEEKGEEYQPPQKPTTEDWLERLKPADQDTRMGESLLKLMQDFRGENASALIVISDGGLNAGAGYPSIVQTAKDAGGRKGANLKIFTVGTGSTKSQPNLRIASLDSPSEVHTKDKFEINVRLLGQNLEGKQAEVVLKEQFDEAGSLSTAREVGRKTVTLAKDGMTVKVEPFELEDYDDPANLRFTVEANLLDAVSELKADDNVKSANVSVSNKRTRVLMVAGGPMRDYRFLTGIVSRNPSFKARAFLQTVDPATFEAVSQSVELLTEFPATMEELNGPPEGDSDETGYDVIVFFDPDWNALVDLQPNVLPLLKRWVSEFSGGVVFVAGDVFTHDLARASENDGGPLEPVHTLYPVFLNPHSFDFLTLETEFDQAAQIELTDAGYAAEFLQITDNPTENRDLWDEEFEGIYRCYPTSGPKAGATVYAHLADTKLAETGQKPILLASQMYGSGKSVYLGSGETWRLRALSNTLHERFWTKLIREAGEGRRSKGRSPVNLTLEKEVKLGSTVRLEAEVLDATFQPTEYEFVKARLYDPNGIEMIPEPKLYPTSTARGEYVGDFRATELGWYTIKLPIPGTESYREESVQVVNPGLEDTDTEQAVAKLADLARQTGGRYFSIDEAAKELPALLTDKHKIVPVDQQIETLWDRQWVLYALVAVLSVEWLTRKLLKLA